MRKFTLNKAENTFFRMGVGDTILITFTGENCAPCKMMKKSLENVNDIAGMPIYELDVEEAPSLVSMFNVMSVPTTVKISGKMEIGRAEGLKTHDQLVSIFK